MNHLIVITLAVLVVVIFAARHRLRPWTFLIGGAIAWSGGVIGLIGDQLDMRLCGALKLDIPTLWEDGFLQLAVVSCVLVVALLFVFGMSDFEPRRSK